MRRDRGGRTQQTSASVERQAQRGPATASIVVDGRHGSSFLIGIVRFTPALQYACGRWIALRPWATLCQAILSPAQQETSGQAEKPLTDADRAKFRSQARGWLEAELKAWSGLLESAKAQKQRQAIAGTLKHWREDTDLASVRDKHGLASLPEGERAMWKTLWADVDRLLTKALTP
jgi:hypothetical protein